MVYTSTVHSGSTRTSAFKADDMYLPMERDRLLAVVKGSADASETQFRQKFRRIADRYAIYLRRDTDPLKNIHGNLVYVVLDALLSLEYSYEVSVNFEPAENLPVSRARAAYRTAALEQDYRQGDYGNMIDRARFFKYFTGIGALLWDKWHTETQRPSLVAIPTNVLLLDPFGGTDPQKHRYLGMQVKYRVSEMLGKHSGFDQDAVKRLISDSDKSSRLSDTVQGGQVGGDNEQQRQADYEAAERGAYPVINDYSNSITAFDPVSGMMPCTLFYATLADQDGIPKRYRIITDQQYREILACRQLKPITMAEKAIPSSVPYPIVFDHFSDTYATDPLESNVFDLVEDKQLAHSRLLNLATNLISKNMLGTLLVQKGAVGASAINYGIDKVIEVDASGFGGLNNAASIAPSQRVDLNAVSGLINEIERMTEKATGVSDSTLGLPAGDFRTLGELRQNQNNANIRHRRRIYRSMKTMERLFTQWFRQYRENYQDSTGKKSIALGSGKSQALYDLKLSDFTEDEPVIVPVSKRIEQEKDTIKAQASLEAMRSAEKAGDIIAYKENSRDYLRATGAYDEEEVQRKEPKLAIELQIESEIDLLSADIYIPLLPTDEVEPRISRQANIPTEAGMRRRLELMQAYEQTKQRPQAGRTVLRSEGGEGTRGVYQSQEATGRQPNAGAQRQMGEQPAAQQTAQREVREGDRSLTAVSATG